MQNHPPQFYFQQDIQNFLLIYDRINQLYEILQMFFDKKGTYPANYYLKLCFDPYYIFPMCHMHKRLCLYQRIPN